MNNKITNPQEECLKALRNLTQLDPEVYFSSSAVCHQVYHNVHHNGGLTELKKFSDSVIKANLEFFVCTGDAEHVIVSRGYEAINGNPRNKALYAYRAILSRNTPNSPPSQTP